MGVKRRYGDNKHLKNRAKAGASATEKGVPRKIRRLRRPFIFGAPAAEPDGSQPKKTRSNLAEAGSAAPDKDIHVANGGKVVTGEPHDQTNHAAPTQSPRPLAAEEAQLRRDALHRPPPQPSAPPHFPNPSTT